MTNEKLNIALYKKMYAEQEKYRNWLLSQQPDKILKHTYEYTIRQEIMIPLEYHDLSDKQARALLKSPTPLADIFTKWKNKETNHMDDIWSTVESRADEVLRADSHRLQVGESR